ncbi:hypothetical protein A6302_00557 [Methylobrevis pamukkalensis]|uniref:Transcription termination/antitermination protein NusA n=1 Tax=Methylobrevis pamukkalensis TaxID=1439726 RepID=A0A1E3H749_9HYPH|nr:hypothetical protein A6302_00557 [Methylobrevis pamukkalensis]
MMVALGKDGVLTVEDLAGCATDDLVGWSERKNGETQRFKGALSDFEISRTDAEAMVLAARVAAGWIEADAEEVSEDETSGDDVADDETETDGEAEVEIEAEADADAGEEVSEDAETGQEPATRA